MYLLLCVLLISINISHIVSFQHPNNRISSTLKYNHNIHESFKLYANKRITPNRDSYNSMDDYRNAVMKALQSETKSNSKFDGRELLKLLISKWGVAYDIQLRKNAPFGDASANIYINIMWRYFGQKSFPMNEREYLEHLEAIARYINAIGKVDDFKDKVKESRKRPNSYFGYAVGLPLDVDPNTADKFFKDLPYE